MTHLSFRPGDKATTCQCPPKPHRGTAPEPDPFDQLRQLTHLAEVAAVTRNRISYSPYGYGPTPRWRALHVCVWEPTYRRMTPTTGINLHHTCTQETL